MLLLMNEEYIRFLIKHTKSTSQSVSDALVEHLLHGTSQELCAKHYGLSTQSGISRLKTSVIKLDKMVRDAIEIKSRLGDN